MVRPETLRLAGLFTVACLGGKALAALLARPFLHFSGSEAGVVFGLTSPQTAATLAATNVGFKIGLFSTSVVNAVLVLILISLVVAPLAANLFAKHMDPAPAEKPSLGDRVLVATDDSEPMPGLLRMAARIAKPDGGIVQPVLCAVREPLPTSAVLSTGSRRHSAPPASTARWRPSSAAPSPRAWRTQPPSGRPRWCWWSHSISSRRPLSGRGSRRSVLCRPTSPWVRGRTERIGRVLLACDEGAGDGGLGGSVAAVSELARRLGAPVVRSAGAEEHDFVEGDVLVVAVTTSVGHRPS